MNQLMIDFEGVTQTKVWSSPRIRFTHAVYLVTLLLLVIIIIALEFELYGTNEESFLTGFSEGKFWSLLLFKTAT